MDSSTGFRFQIDWYFWSVVRSFWTLSVEVVGRPSDGNETLDDDDSVAAIGKDPDVLPAYSGLFAVSGMASFSTIGVVLVKCLAEKGRRNAGGRLACHRASSAALLKDRLSILMAKGALN
jgi:hypothetical protein